MHNHERNDLNGQMMMSEGEAKVNYQNF